jgi:hypothetical protein
MVAAGCGENFSGTCAAEATSRADYATYSYDLMGHKISTRTVDGGQSTTCFSRSKKVRASFVFLAKRLLSSSRIASKGRAADSERIRQPMRILELGQCLHRRAVPHKAQQQRLATRQQTEMRVGQGKHRQESEGSSASDTAAPANLDPIVIRVMRLLAPSAMTNNRILFTNRVSA